MLGGWSRAAAMGTWWARKVPSTGWPSTIGGPGPALRGAQHDHRPAGQADVTVVAGRVLEWRRCRRGRRRGWRPAPGGPRPGWCRARRSTTRGSVAVAAEEVEQVGFGDAGQDGGVGDLVAVEVQDGQDRAVAGRIEELVGVPAGGQRAGLGFPVADHAKHGQLGVVERGAVGVEEGVAELAALVERPGRLGGARGWGRRPGNENCRKSRRIPRGPGRSTGTARCRCLPARRRRWARARRDRAPSRRPRRGPGPGWPGWRGRR